MLQRIHLFPEIRSGRRNRFKYQGDLFIVDIRPDRWIITRPVTGDTVQCAFPIKWMGDLWNAADCLLFYERHLYIDEDYVIHLLTE
jgi:hypothetical protein